jgi:hypothetical protein
MKELMPEKETPPEVHKLQNEVFGQNQPQSKPVPHEPETRFLGWNAVVSRR